MSTGTPPALDPYRDWLGLPAAPRPPDHYLLLGLPRFETDPDKVRAAARARMKTVRPRCLKHPELGTRLLNEIAAAQVCLLDPARAAEYNRTLGGPAAKGKPAPAPKPLSPPALAEDEIYKVVWEEDDDIPDVKAADDVAPRPAAGADRPVKKKPAGAAPIALQATGFPFGIGLGFAAVSFAYVTPRDRVCPLEIRNGVFAVPVAVAANREELLVGEPALAQQASGAVTAVTGFHRQLGVPGTAVAVGDQTFPPEMLAALLLRGPMERVEQLGSDLNEAVVAVPHFFDTARRDAVREVAQRVGICKAELVDDPVAVALAAAAPDARVQALRRPDYLEEAYGGGLLLVFDLDDETCEATVLHLTRRRRLNIVGGDSLANLGGRAWDEVFLEMVCAAFEDDTGMDPRDDPKLMQRLRLNAWAARTRLDVQPRTAVSVRYEGEAVKYEFTRQAFESATAKLLRRVELLADGMLDENDVPWEDLDAVVLAGDASRMPAVRQLFKDRVRPKVALRHAPDAAKAQGAVLYGLLQSPPP